MKSLAEYIERVEVEGELSVKCGEAGFLFRCVDGLYGVHFERQADLRYFEQIFREMPRSSSMLEGVPLTLYYRGKKIAQVGKRGVLSRLFGLPPIKPTLYGVLVYGRL